MEKLASLGQMTAAIMHEIGNPLAAIKAKIQVSAEAGADAESSIALLGEIDVEINRLAGFLRTFSRLPHLRETRRESASLSEIVRGVASLVAPELRRRGLSLHLDERPGIPRIEGDPDQLRQLLLNLILNAMQASAAGGEIVVRLRAGSRSRGDVARIEVVDRGVGMPPHVLDRVWEPFFTTKEDGTGLGMSISRSIAEEHGGTVSAWSQTGQGTVITVMLPARVRSDGRRVASARHAGEVQA